jgi:HPt (histidine-containing phosphotransfer) domain-containing protein
MKKQHGITMNPTAEYEEIPLRAEIFNRRSLTARLCNDTTACTILLSHFLEMLPELVAAVTSAYAAANIPSVERAAHRLRGAASNVGAEALAAMAQRIEENAPENRLDDTMINRLEYEAGLFGTEVMKSGLV